MVVDDTKLDALQQLCTLATVGPWAWWGASGSLVIGAPGNTMIAGGVDRPEDAALIVAARMRLPELLAEVRRLREDLRLERHALNSKYFIELLQYDKDNTNLAARFQEAEDYICSHAASDGWEIGQPVASA